MPRRSAASCHWPRAAFAAGTDDMVIAGVLPETAADLRVSEPAAGRLVTVSTLVFGLGTPVMPAPSQARLARRHGMGIDRVRVTTLSTHESDRP
ncbi:hypothetical protein ACFVJW_09250 [Streptomyces libani]|uniref:hypothetical protein n=1 Tax=Streptomyces nigrescens TaxID=1920 RepID=UPI00363917FE